MRYDPLTRLLHLCLAFGVTAQMVVSLGMVHPKPGRLPNFWYEVHEALGVGLLAVLVVHWLWSAGRSFASGGAFLLFPWFSARRLRDVAEDARDTLACMVRGRLPGEDGATRPLPAAIQGLGLLGATFLAASGTVLMLGMGPDGRLSAPLHAIKEAHEAVAPLMWAYLAIHPTLALLHQLSGHRTLSRMFGRG